jgi:beta-glucanase (GH16 family)
MTQPLTRIFIVILFSFPLCAQAPKSKPHWVLSWSDEFNLLDGSTVDRTRWTPEVGGNGFGNHELEYYTNRLKNLSIKNGKLVIEARREKYTGPDKVTRDYTSARLHTRKKFSQAYGRFEARIKLPYGQGIWPAFWLLGSDMDKVDWPDCGEIDIMENVGHERSAVHGTIHGPGYNGPGGISATYQLPGKRRFSDEFHVFAVEWEPNEIRFYVDKTLYATRTSADLPAGKKWVFDHPFFVLLNLAVGGDWPGSPDKSTVFPQTMLVDYVRVYRRSAGE